MANGDKTILYVDKIAIDNYRSLDGGNYFIFNVGVYKSIRFNDEERYDIVQGLKNTIISSSQNWYGQYRTEDYITDSTEIVQINSKDYYKLDAYIWTEGYTYSSGQKLFFAIGRDTMTSRAIAENNSEQTVVEFDYNLNKVTPDYLLWDATDGVESLKISYTEPPHKIISEIQYPDETIYDIKDKNALNKSQITNCLLEVPQKIKLELNNGVLTLKAGSKVIVPNGFEADGTTPKFDEVVIKSDVVRSNFSTTKDQEIFIHYVSNENSLSISTVSLATSGTTAPTTSSYIFYNTGTNYLYDQNGSNKSFPIAICTLTTSGVTSINQVFNGMGYIGSTVWVDKGVKGLIPNGRNEDGSLRNIEYLNDKLKTYDNSGVTNVSRMFVLKQNGTFTRALSYKVNDDGYLVNSDGVYTDGFVCGDIVFGSNSITSFNPKLPFSAVDYNDVSKTPHIIGTYVNGTSGYRIWSDGYCEQWGRANYPQVPANGTKSTTITFLKKFANVNYCVSHNIITDGGSTQSLRNHWTNPQVETLQFGWYSTVSTSAGGIFGWRACGYLASGQY